MRRRAGRAESTADSEFLRRAAGSFGAPVGAEPSLLRLVRRLHGHDALAEGGESLLMTVRLGDSRGSKVESATPRCVTVGGRAQGDVVNRASAAHPVRRLQCPASTSSCQRAASSFASSTSLVAEHGCQRGTDSGRELQGFYTLDRGRVRRDKTSEWQRYVVPRIRETKVVRSRRGTAFWTKRVGSRQP